MRDLRRRVGREELDYQALMAALSKYSNPRDKVTALLRRGDIIRAKKGLYIFGDELRRRPYSRELLANLIYGPSFVSLDSALSFHGLIPERVEALMSVTTKRPKSFDTPIGSFIYRQSPRGAFHIGMDRVEEGDVVEADSRETARPARSDEQLEMAGAREHGDAIGCPVLVDHPVVPHVDPATDHRSAVMIDADFSEHRMLERDAVGQPEVCPSGGVGSHADSRPDPEPEGHDAQ